MDLDGRTLWSLVFVIVAAFAFKYVPRWLAGVPFVEPEVLKKRLDDGDDVVVLDVRTHGEFIGKRGHIPGATNVPMGDLQVRLRAHERELETLKVQPIFVHCHGEGRAARSAKALRAAGFTDVSVVKGGMHAWWRRGYPIECSNARSS